ncbi:ABC transporter permease [Chitinophaga horti]|uniref:Transport permease protein n=1 Tax=Chitinophaga horti TaxID=2920382 RepID=A0ABY6IV12_9BACT|nr:ABC transporter permease [Chitinophaga horti]UYQ91036.1 ABC transporter permease [Chitinophaga horti]
MAEQYSQWRAMLAIMKGSIRAIFRSPSTVVFSLAFPLIFILVFGFMGNRGVTVKVGVDPRTDTTAALYKALVAKPELRLVTDETTAEMAQDLQKGRIAAIIYVQSRPSAGAPNDSILLRTSSAAGQNIRVFRSLLAETIAGLNDQWYRRAGSVATVATEVVPGRKYTTIDFILPGQLGFSLLSAAVFGTAFLFFSLRQTLVLKRFFATPVHRGYIILGEGLSRLLFQLFGAVVIISIGYFAFGFTLINGVSTFAEMLLLCAFGLIVFMGFGFVVSGIAKTESTIPPLANIVTLPQFLLAGTFFSVDSFPTWLQPICRIMPLTYLNDALRKIAFEGLHLWDVWPQIMVLGLWGVVIYAVAIKVFRWE